MPMGLGLGLGLSFVQLVGGGVTPPPEPTTQIVTLPAGTTTWTVPADFGALVEAYAIGPGGDGADAVTNTRGGGGGGGGAFAKITFGDVPGGTINVGDILSVQVGARGSQLPTFLKNNVGTSILVADYGRNASAITGGTGGTTAASIGSVKYAGGAGRDGGNGTFNKSGGGGGGAAGPNGAGALGGVGSSSTGAPGGGAADGGSVGAGANGNTSGGNGGNNILATGAGVGANNTTATNATPGTDGGGGGGGHVTRHASAGGGRTNLPDGTGPGGGGGAGGAHSNGGAGGGLGAGGGGGGSSNTGAGTGGLGTAATLVIVYETATGGGSEVPEGFIEPGPAISGVNLWPADTYNTPEGSLLQPGYDYTPAGVSWSREDMLYIGPGETAYIGAKGKGTPTLTSVQLADPFDNMKEFQFTVGNGPYFSVTTPSVNPDTGDLDYNAPVREQDFPYSGVFEVRGRAIPKVGQPLLMQGADATGSVPQADLDITSFYVVVNKGDLICPSIYKAADNDPRGNDANSGLSISAPISSNERLKALIESYGPNAIPRVKLLDSLDHEWGLASDASAVIETKGWVVFEPAEGVTREEVKFNRLRPGRMAFRWLELNNWLMGEVSIRNTLSSDVRTNTRQRGIRSGRSANISTTPYLTTPLAVSTTSSRVNADHLQIVAAGSTPITNGFWPFAAYPNFKVTNTGSVAAYVKRSTSVSDLPVATTADTLIAAGATVEITWCHKLAAITASGSTTLSIEGVNPQYGQPDNEKWVQAGLGRIEVIDTEIRHSLDTGMFSTTYARDVVIDYVSSYGDMANNSKVLIDVTMSNVQPGVQFNHLDGPQPTNFKDNRHRWFQRLEATSTFTGQFIYGDVGNTYSYSVFDTCRCRTNEWAFAFFSAMKNNRIRNADMLGSTKLATLTYTDSGRPWCNAPAENTHIVYDDDFTGVGLGATTQFSWFENTHRQGITKWHHWMTREQHVGAGYPTSALLTAYGATTLTAVFDPDVDEYVGRIDRDSADPPNFYAPGVYRVQHLLDAKVPEMQGGVTTGTEAALLKQITTVAARPLSIEGTHRGLDFNGDTSSLTTGSHMYGKIPPLDQTTNVAVSSLATSDPAAVAMALNIDADSSTTLKWFYHSGRTATFATGIGRQVVSGVHQLYVRCGQTNGTTDNTITLTSGTSAPAVTGPTVVLFEMLSDRIRLTYWNAATAAAPNTADGGYAVEKTYASNDATRTTLKHALTIGQDMAVGTFSAINSPLTTAAFDWYGGGVSGALDTTPRAAVIADLKGRVGLS